VSLAAREPASNPQPSGLVLALATVIVCFAGFLRLWNIGAGIPYNVGADEPQVMLRVAHMMKTGDFNPHFFDWPTLVFYMNLVVACVMFLLGSMRGAWNDLAQVGAPELYLTGRVFTALLGTATVGLTFAAGRRWGTGVALVAAALLAVIPNHVRESHYVLTDIPTAFFCALTLVLSLRAFERKATSSLVWAAVAAGLAGSCKYNGFIAIVMPLLVAVGSEGRAMVRLQRSLMVAGVAVAAFLVTTPFAVLDLPKFLSDYARLAANFARERGGEPGWSIYLKHLASALAWPALLASIAGAGLMFWRVIAGPNRMPAALLVVFTCVYFVVMARSYQIYGRYLLPLFPFVSLLAGIAMVAGIDALRRVRVPVQVRRLAAVALVVVPLSTPAINGIGFSRQLGLTTTVDLAYRWILTNVPAGSKVVVESTALRLPNQYHTVFVRSLLDQRFEDYESQGVQYFLAASGEFQSTLRDPQNAAGSAGAYRAVLGPAREIAAFDATESTPGPSMRLYQLTK
jgi:4-amino-4-deoxy-L-arabinose transferase-like glycosyltransferase